MKTIKQKLRFQADKLWFKLTLKPSCEVCDKPAVQSHHFYYKSSYGHLRYEIENGISLCRGCHFVLHHQDPKKIEEKIIKSRGRYWYSRLKKKSQLKPLPSYQTIKYYETILKTLSSLLEAI